MKKRMTYYILMFFLLAAGLWSCKDKTTAETEPSSCCSTNPRTYDSDFELPETSVYNLDGNWSDQHGRQIELKGFAGKPIILTMFFTHCEYACPLLVHDMKGIETLLENKKDQFTFVLVSFDNKRDTPERLKTYAQSQGVDDNWVFLHGDANQIKTLSVMLNINYEALENGQFAHSNRKLVLDRDGVVIFQQDGLQTKAEPMVNALKPLL
jgi:protein SCO1